MQRVNGGDEMIFSPNEYWWQILMTEFKQGYLCKLINDWCRSATNNYWKLLLYNFSIKFKIGTFLVLPFFPIQSINNFITYPDAKLEGINNQKLKQTSKILHSFGPCAWRTWTWTRTWTLNLRVYHWLKISDSGLSDLGIKLENRKEFRTQVEMTLAASHGIILGDRGQGGLSKH